MCQKTNSLILINKPVGLTSHDVINVLRRVTGIKKIGHTGTLDPFSSGLLPVLIGREATRQQRNFLFLDKTYWVKIRLGAFSDTHDLTGKIIEKEVKEVPKNDIIKEALSKFVGGLDQKPPIFSAKKVKGKKAYQLARKGIRVELKPKRIKIYEIKLLSYQWPFLETRIKVSAGTYLRKLAHDFGEKIGSGAYLEGLIREKIGMFDLKEAIDLKKITSENWQSYVISLTKVKF